MHNSVYATCILHRVLVRYIESMLSSGFVHLCTPWSYELVCCNVIVILNWVHLLVRIVIIECKIHIGYFASNVDPNSRLLYLLQSCISWLVRCLEKGHMHLSRPVLISGPTWSMLWKLLTKFHATVVAECSRKWRRFIIVRVILTSFSS